MTVKEEQDQLSGSGRLGMLELRTATIFIVCCFESVINSLHCPHNSSNVMSKHRRQFSKFQMLILLLYVCVWYVTDNKVTLHMYTG